MSARTRPLPLLFAAALLAALLAAPAEGQGEKHLLRYKFAPADAYVVTTEVLTESTTSGNRHAAGMTSRDRLRAVSADAAKITLERECLSLESRAEHISPNDIHLLAKGQKVRLETSPDGKTRKILASPIKGYEDHLLMALPAHPVAVGDTWPENGEIDVPYLGKMELRGAWTFSQLKELNGARLAYLLYKGDMRDTRRGASARDEVRIVFDVDAGVPRKLKATHDISFTVQETRKIDTKLSIECAVERETTAPAPKTEEW